MDRIEEGESDRLMHLEEILSKRIVGWGIPKGVAMTGPMIAFRNLPVFSGSPKRCL